MRRICLLVLILLLTPRTAWTAEVSADINRQELAMGETLSLTVTIEDGDGDVDLTPLETGEAFRVVSRSTSTRLNIINFKSTRTSSYFIGLTPLKTGRLTIPSLKVSVDGQDFSTPKFTVNVTDAGGAASAVPNQGGNTARSGNPLPAASGGDAIMLVPEVSLPQPYLHEQFLYTLKIYLGQGIRNPRLQDPNFNGFSVKKLGKPKQYRATANNRPYAVTEIRYLLTPEKTGAITIGPATLHYEVVQQVRSRGRSPFDKFFDDDFFFSNLRTEPRSARSTSMPLEVRPLPVYSGAQPFSGLVGSFTLEASLDKTTFPMGDSALLNLSLKGSGNIRDAGEPDLAIPDAFKVYKEKPEEQVTAGPSGITGQKIFRQALVPLQAGDYTIPESSLVYFDTAKKAYQTIRTQPLRLSVTPAAHAEKTVIATPAPEKPVRSAAKQQVKFLDKDILPLKEDLSALKDSSPLAPGPLTLLLALPPGLVVLLLAGKRYARPRENQCKTLSRRAEAALQEARQCAAQSAPEARSAASGHCAKALLAAVFARTEREGGSLTYAEAQEALLAHGVTQERAEAVVALMQRVDAAQYGGTASSELESLIADVQSMVKELCA